MYILVCDENIDDRKWVSEMIAGYRQQKPIEMIVEDFNSGSELLFRIEDILHQVDLIYLGVLLTGEHGFKIAAKVRDMGYIGDIVFVSDSAQYAPLAFDYNALNYLVKGKTTDERFFQVLDKAVERRQSRERKVIMLQCAGENKVIPIDDIKYFEIIKRIVTVHYGTNESFEFYSTITRLEEELMDAGFLRTHKSYLVNQKYIAKMTARSIKLTDGVELPAGQGFVSKIKSGANAAIY